MFRRHLQKDLLECGSFLLPFFRSTTLLNLSSMRSIIFHPGLDGNLYVSNMQQEAQNSKVKGQKYKSKGKSVVYLTSLLSARLSL